MSGRAMRLTPRDVAPSLYEIRVGGEALRRFARDWPEAVRSAKDLAKETTQPVTIAGIHTPDRIEMTVQGGKP